MDYDYEQNDMQFGDKGGVYNGEREEEQQEEQGEREDYYEGNQQQEEQEIGSAGNQRKHSRDPSSSAAGKLFVGGISWETTEETFTSYFSKYGEIMDSVIMMDRHSGRPRGFGFVTFADPAVADRVLEEDHVIDGRSVEVKKTVPREDIGTKGVVRTKKIFVGGIPSSLTEDDLKEYFSYYGSIVEHQIMLDHKTGRSRGFGFVTFESEEAVERIFSEGKMHELGGKQVEIKKAEPKRSGDYGSAPKSYTGFSNNAGAYGADHGAGGRYGGKMGRGYGGYGSYGSYGGYGNFGGGYSGSAAGFYGGYGGYGYGFGFGGPMMYGGGGGGGAYGGTGYGASSGYGGAAGYGGGKGYGRSGDSGGFGSGKAYGNGDAYSSGKGYGGTSNGDGRYHPYRK